MQYQESGAHLQLVVEVAKKYSEQLGCDELIKLFEEYECWSGLYLYLGSMVDDTKDSNVVYKYLLLHHRLDNMHN